MQRSTEQHNFHHLVWNATWFGMATPAISRFLPVFAIHIGASPIMLGLLSALPGIGALLTAALANRWMCRYTSSVKAVFLPAFGLRLNYLLLVFTPLLPPTWQPAWLMLTALFPAMAEGVSSVVFLVMMREAVHEKLITPLISRRHFGMNFALAISTLALGFWLEHTIFPANYQVMFGLCFIFAIVSLWHTAQVKVQPREYSEPVEQQAQTKTSVWRSTGFQSVAIATMVTHITFFALVPIIPLWLINKFKAGEQFIALYGLAELAAAVLMASVASRLITRIGNRAMISLAMIGTGLAAIILAFAPHVNLTLIASALSGASWTAVNVSLFGYFSERTPVTEAPRFTTAYIQTIYLAVFIGPMLGSFLANQGVDLAVVLLLGAAARLAAGCVTQIDLPQFVRRSPVAATNPIR